MKKNGKTVANLLLFLLSVIFLVEYVTCPSSGREGLDVMAKLSKVIVRHKESGVVHVYNNAIAYQIKPPKYATEVNPAVKWLTIRARKSRKENFRTLIDICGMEVEFILLTDELVKMIYNEDYEYTLHFEGVWNPKYFVNFIYEVSRKTGREMACGTLATVSLVQDDGDSDVIATPAKLVQRSISDQENVYLIIPKQEDVMMREEVKVIFPSRHFVIEVKVSREVLITPMEVKGRPLDYKYKLEFRDRLAAQNFIRCATNHQFVTRNAPDDEPQDAGVSDSSFTSDGCDFYDAQEFQFFEHVETNYDRIDSLF